MVKVTLDMGVFGCLLRSDAALDSGRMTNPLTITVAMEDKDGLKTLGSRELYSV